MSNRQVTIHQIAFDKKSAEMVNPRSELIMNPKTSKYFENDVIRENCKKVSSDGIYGFLSYRYESKNNLEIDFDQLSQTKSDIVVMPNCWAFTDPIKEGVKYHGEGFKLAMDFILDDLEEQFELDFGKREFTVSVHQNAILATSHVWKRYEEWLFRAMHIMENDPFLKAILDQDSGYRGKLSKDRLVEIGGYPFYTLHTFVLERLLSVFVCYQSFTNFTVDYLVPVEKYRLPKVLVCAPQHQSKMYCFAKWYKRVKELTYMNFEVYLSDNSDTNENTEYLRSLGIKADWVRPKEEGLIATMAESHNACAKYALENGFDYILHLETDIIPPRDVIEQLLAWKKTVVGGTYDLFYGSGRKAMIQQVESYDRSIRAFTSAQFVEETEPLYFDGHIHRVYHIGLGCVLIHRDVLSKIKFRYEKGVNAHPDTWFANDCFQYQIPIYVDGNIQCKHWNQTWLLNIDEINKNLNLK